MLAGGGLQLSHDIYTHADEMDNATLAITSGGSLLAVTSGIAGIADEFNSTSCSYQSLINLTLASIGYLTAYTVLQQRKQNKKIDAIVELLHGSREFHHGESVVILESLSRGQQAIERTLAAIKSRLESADLNQCAVCMEPLIDGQHPVDTKSLSCGHIFHTSCVNPWLAQHAQCPACRTDHVASSDPSHDPSSTPQP